MSYGVGSHPPGGVGARGVPGGGVGVSVWGQTGKNEACSEMSQLNLLLKFSLLSKFREKHFVAAPSASTGSIANIVSVS